MYLVRHTKLNCLRIVKCISKGAVFYEQGAAEAKLLLSLKHPGIPILYDYLEDDHHVYIVEEYVRGQSLTEYLLYHKISQEQLRIIAIKLCEILRYLREQGSVPVLYKDMKPEHVILNGEDVRLIDFGIATEEDQMNKMEIYGTPGFSAPELADSIATEKSDIYSLAKTLGYIVEQSQIKSKGISRLIHLGTQEVPNDRPDLDEFYEAWKNLPEKRLVHGGISKTIAVVGNDYGVGCTHIAISLAVFLRDYGYEAYYRNPDVRKAVLENIQRNASVFREKDSLIYHNKFYGVRSLGSTVEKEKPPDGIYVQDCGTDLDQAEEADWIVLVLGSSLWKDQRIPEWKDNNISIICNPGNRGAGLKIARVTGCKVYGFPLDKDPFSMTTEKRKVLEKIRKEVWN